MLLYTNVKLQLTLLSQFLLDLRLLVSTNYFKFDNLDNPLIYRSFYLIYCILSKIFNISTIYYCCEY